METKTLQADFIKDAALSVGFDACGIAQATELTDDASFLRSWLDAGIQGDMHYMERNFEKRIDPRVLVPGCKTVVVVLLNYHPEKTQDPQLPKIAKYAYSNTDYHLVIKDKLLQLEHIITETYGSDCVSETHQHIFTDSGPVFEKRWAEKAGLGWIGRNKLLVTKKFGSSISIGILMLNVEVESDHKPVPFSCGHCTKCVDACPTGALSDSNMDARKCISYLTVEAKSPIPEDLKNKLNGWIVGCDVCINVCPWNKRFAHPHNHPELEPTPQIYTLTKKDWMEMTQEEFNTIFKYSAVRRADLNRIKNTIY
ncbi:MAG: tRNA epoxyqueuosine(34) reductase QueG [Paludibacter sp.]|jgi:epoxyqueuosine reductase|nr:tRNA epoxyqueuosine(34) reductase QueG [Paludibacter sp.]HOS46346.1 tRNA epoxyqueuosine(34) reductase QueG [Paludibacter sp.]HPM10662.1 tRNA epoxyqueuosine(34) reductase QueG [Paludibacter sp.]